MPAFPLSYVEPLFRPPSEARSLILQVTNGCSYNRCTFCDMYTAPQKKFRPKPEAEVQREISAVAQCMPGVERVFLADGDAMALSVRRLRTILEQLRESLPAVRRVSAYCLPRNLLNKSVEELVALRELGLQLLYVGAESGDDEVLAAVRKGETYDSTLEALNKIRAAGIKVSVMLLNGLGGRRLSHQHALNSARLISAAQPEYLATLVVSFPYGLTRIQEGYDGTFEPLTQPELFQEMAWLLENLRLEKTIFRSDHASNYLVLKGVLGRDRERLLEQVRTAMAAPDAAGLRAEWMRGF